MQISSRKLFALVLFLGLFLMTLRPIADPDFWWHLRTGQLISETHTIPRSDPFSLTFQDKPWVAHEWLSELTIFWLYTVGGAGLLIFFFSAITTLPFFLMFSISAGKPYGAGFALLLASIASAPTWGVRPQIFSLLLAAFFLFFLSKYQQSHENKYLFPLPFLTILWVNLHAGYILGLALLGLFILAEALLWLGSLLKKDRQFPASLLALGLTLVGCVLGAAINPNGFRILIYPFETITSAAMMQFIQEWFSPNFQQLEWLPLALLFLCLIATPALFRRPVPLSRLLIVLFFGFATLRSMRHVALFALTAIPFLADQLAGLLPPGPNQPKRPKWATWLHPALLSIVVLLVAGQFYSVLRSQPESESFSSPQSAVSWIIANQPEGNIYNTYGWGGYLIWKLHPDYPVYIDGRADLYGDDFMVDYMNIYTGQPGWQNALQQAGINILLIEPGSPLANLAQSTGEWETVLKDDLSLLLVRK